MKLTLLSLETDQTKAWWRKKSFWTATVTALKSRNLFVNNHSSNDIWPICRKTVDINIAETEHFFWMFFFMDNLFKTDMMVDKLKPDISRLAQPLQDYSWAWGKIVAWRSVDPWQNMHIVYIKKTV